MGAVAGGLLSVGSSIIGGNSARKASKAAAGQLNNAMTQNREIYDESKQNFNPFLTGGTESFNQLANMANTGDMSSFYTSPGYQFRLDQGLKGMQNAAAGRGMLNSPRTMQALNDYAQNMASNEYGNYFQNMLNLGQVGQNAAGSLGNLGSGFASAQSGLYQGLGNIYANKNIATGQANQGILGGFGTMLGGMGGGASGGLFGSIGNSLGIGNSSGAGIGSYTGLPTSGSWS
jgi:hypothetical protein